MYYNQTNDIKDIALKLNDIRTYCPEDYFYLKGWIHCLSHQKKPKKGQPKPPEKKT